MARNTSKPYMSDLNLRDVANVNSIDDEVVLLPALKLILVVFRFQ